MTAKEYLNNIAKIEKRIDAKKQRYLVLKNIASSPASPKHDGMPRNPSKGTQALSDTVIKYLDLEDEIKADELELEKKKVFIIDLLGNMPEVDYQTVLIKRYFEKKAWGEIATDMFYTTRWIYTIHGRALKQLEEVYNNELL